MTTSRERECGEEIGMKGEGKRGERKRSGEKRGMKEKGRKKENDEGRENLTLILRKN